MIKKSAWSITERTKNNKTNKDYSRYWNEQLYLQSTSAEIGLCCMPLFSVLVDLEKRNKKGSIKYKAVHDMLVDKVRTFDKLSEIEQWSYYEEKQRIKKKMIK